MWSYVSVRPGVKRRRLICTVRIWLSCTSSAASNKFCSRQPAASSHGLWLSAERIFRQPKRSRQISSFLKVSNVGSVIRQYCCDWLICCVTTQIQRIQQRRPTWWNNKGKVDAIEQARTPFSSTKCEQLHLDYELIEVFCLQTKIWMNTFTRIKQNIEKWMSMNLLWMSILCWDVKWKWVDDTRTLQIDWLKMK